MRKILRSILKTIDQTFSFLLFLGRLLFNSKHYFPHRKNNYGTIAVLANGPSLNDIIKEIETSNEFEEVEDYIVMNYFAFHKLFFQIRPKYYCLADPMFFIETHRIDEVRKLFEVFENKITWQMNLFIPSNYNQFREFSKLTNENINIVSINSLEYTGYNKFRNYFYSKGYSCPKIQTVANLAIYVSINLGYKIIKLYGVDHTFFDSLCINENNQLCNKEEHFYNDKSALKPILKNEEGTVWKISEYLEAIMHMFKSHDELSAYAKYVSVNIINYTKNSMIDSYKRINK